MNAIEAEIVRLHDFFEGWFTGRLPRTRETFAGVAEALGEDFVLISPRGAIDHRDELLEAIWEAHDGRDAGFVIRIEDVQVRRDGAIALATYEEWQSSSGAESRGRLSTAVFARRDDRLAWLHVHETWLTSA